jgi:hypothetical protein
MTRPTLDQMLDAEGDRIMKAMKSGHAQDYATWVAFLEDGSRVAIDTPFPDEISELAKMIALSFVEWQLKEMGAWGYTMASEAWMSAPTPMPEGMTQEEINRHRESLPMPSEDPNRLEVLVVTAVTRKEKRTRTWKMIRNARGKLIDFSLHEPDGPEGAPMICGRFTDLLG